MITINNQPILDAVEKHEDPKTKIAFKADSNPVTLDKLLIGDPDISLSSIDKLAGFLGFDAEVRFVRRKKATV
jgi:hypothetical protein